MTEPTQDERKAASLDKQRAHLETRPEEAILRLRQAVKEVREVQVSEAQTPDFAGGLNASATSLAAHKRLLLSEIAEELEGENYRIKLARAGDRAYNVQRILSDLAETEGGVVEALLMLISTGTAKLNIGWQKLEVLYKDKGLDLAIRNGSHDVHTLDDPHVGVIWKDKPPTLEGIKGDQP